MYYAMVVMMHPQLLDTTNCIGGFDTLGEVQESIRRLDGKTLKNRFGGSFVFRTVVKVHTVL